MEMLKGIHVEMDKEQWRFKKEISLADIFSLTAASAAVLYAYTTLDRRLAIVEAERTSEKVALLAFQNRMDARLDKMDDKLDRIIQRQQR
jgi:hypothetical protein